MCAALGDAVHTEKSTVWHCNARSSLHLPHHAPHAAAVAPARAPKQSGHNCAYGCAYGLGFALGLAHRNECGRRPLKIAANVWFPVRGAPNEYMQICRRQRWRICYRSGISGSQKQCSVTRTAACSLVCAARPAVLLSICFGLLCLVAVPCGAMPAVHTHRRTWRQERALNTQ